MQRPRTPRLSYPYRQAMTTRWRDNDAYGHMNNVVYYEFFDSVVNQWLAGVAGLPVPGGPVIGLVAQTSCSFHESLGWPEPLEAGLATLRTGRTSVTYGIGLFRPGAEFAAAEGLFVHVYVDAASRRPVALPDGLRAAALAIAVPG